ncbi:MAG: FAD-dependent oxidoreductase [Methanomassiliicoccales archaeon]|nr:MAG: FAD-dependent oxidoreductase [Methanomassiliicoccales archaeon]
MLSRQNKRTITRWAIFFIVLIGLPLGGFAFFTLATVCFIDPFFWIQSIAVIIGGGTVPDITLRISLMITIAVGGLIIFTVIFGRAFCSWICPYGSLLTFFGKLRRKKRELPEVLKDTNIKYGVLLGFFLAAMVLGRYAWCDVCPIGGLYRSTGPFFYNPPWLIAFPMIFFIAIALMAVYYEPRGFCKYLCPLGAFIATFDRISFMRVQLPSDRCVECHKCDDICPMGIDIVNETRFELLNDKEVKKELEKAGVTNLSRENFDELPKALQEKITRNLKFYKVPPGECIRCYQCVDVCPVLNEKAAVPAIHLDPLIRVTNFEEVNKGYTPELAYKEAKRCLQCEDHPCMDACPASQDVPGYVKAIVDGDPSKSLDIILDTNPLPLTCGRVCPAFCKSVCVRGKNGDPIAIPTLKRFAADKGKFPRLKPERKTGKKVAVIGSGPAGLTVAWELAKMGHEVTMFESLPVAGGMLAVGIPEYRLPEDVLSQEIGNITALGVELKSEAPIGKENNFEELFKQGFDAIFVGVGAHVPREMRVPGEDLEGVIPATDFLRDVNLGKEVTIGKKVAVIGGGNVAMDAVRTSLRLGAEKAMIIYRRAEEQMPADPMEVEESREEGVEYHFLRNPTKIIGQKGKVVGMELLKMKLGEPDASGRRRPVPIEGSNYTIRVDTVIPAISQSPDLSWVPEGTVNITKWNSVEADEKTGATAMKGVFAAGDGVTGPQTVIEAVAGARKAAQAMDKFLRSGDRAAS